MDRTQVKRQDMRRLLRSLWIRACRADGVDPASKFVLAFLNDNPYAERYNTMMRMYQAGRELLNKMNR